MCGIAGIAFIGKQEISIKESILKMSALIGHRGPDDEGFVLFNENQHAIYGSSVTPEEVYKTHLDYCPKKNLVSQNVEEKFQLALAHRRLSIIDLSPFGHQPLCDKSNRYWITFNGEIYNFPELKNELESKGFVFRSKTDTEVVLASFIHWGKDCVNRFNGMWSFVIYDKENYSIFASRDRFGVKPFYYFYKNGIFCFASEQKAIALQNFYPREINPKAVFDFFEYNELEYEEEGFFKDIFELFPSQNLTLNLTTGKLTKEPYYQLPVNYDAEKFNAAKYINIIAKTKNLFTDAVRLRMRSDVEVGTCLSGGIDSSAISGAMHNLLGGQKQIHLFTAIFPKSSSIDESGWAEQMAKKINGNWHTIEPDSEGLFESLESLIYCQDIPLWSSSTFAQYKVMDNCKKHGIKVVLDGQGGDELFAGYLPYFANYRNELLNHHGLISTLKNLTHAGKFRKNLTSWIIENIKQNNQQWPGKYYDLKKSNKSYYNNLIQNITYNKIKKISGNLNEALEREFLNSRLKLYLKCEDRCSMWHSVEARTPFADDIHLIEHAFSIAGCYKLHHNISKSLLREAAKDFLPSSIYKRKDKMGYVTPNNYWLRKQKNKIKEILGESDLPFINKQKLLDNLDQLLKGETENTLVFKALSYAVWRNKFNM